VSGRPPARPIEIRVGRFGWAAEVPWLPDLLAAPRTVTGNVLAEAFGRQIAFLRALAAGAPIGAAVQLRYTAGGGADRVSCHLVAAAGTIAEAETLSRVVAAALPPEMPLTPVTPAEVNKVLRAVNVDQLTSASLAEIRRSVDRLDPTLDGGVPADSVVFPWTWSPQSLLTSLGLLRQQPFLTTLVIHAEPAHLDPMVALFMQDEIGRLVGELREGEEQPLTRIAIREYGRWLRLLPRAALHLRVLLAAEGELAPGLAASLSTELTAPFEGSAFSPTGVADVVEPKGGAAIDACTVLLDEIRSRPIHPPDHSELAELLHLFDPVEAHCAFRFPVAPRGGLPGIGTRRPAGFGGGMPTRTEDVVVQIGTTTMGTRFGFSLSDLNQHVLVAGLPGFGKSSTVKLLLQRAHLDLGLPFLVIDPAKGDYEQLLGALATETNAECVVHRLRPKDVAFNPLAVPEGVEPAVHGGRVAAVFEGALDFGDWQGGRIVLRRAMARVYDEAAGRGQQPTLVDLYRRCGESVRQSRFSGPTSGDVFASLLGRIEMLGAGPAGRALLGSAGDGVPWGEIMTRPTLIELGDFSGPSERSLIFGLLIAGLVSWREAHPSSELGHITVLEEAHRVLRSSERRDVGIDMFVDAIAELRGAGEGFIVVDQTPTALHPTVLKITGTKLIHRLVEQSERNTVGNAMVLDDSAREDVARLGRQRVVTYAASSDAAELVDVDDWRDRGPDRPPLPADAPADDFVIQSLADTPTGAPIFCVDCPVLCTGRAGLTRVASVTDGIDGTADDATVLRALWGATARTMGNVEGERQQRAQFYCTAAGALAVLSESEPWRLQPRLEKLRELHAQVSSQPPTPEKHERLTVG
jgi:hypothetical protein